MDTARTHHEYGMDTDLLIKVQIEHVCHDMLPTLEYLGMITWYCSSNRSMSSMYYWSWVALFLLTVTCFHAYLDADWGDCWCTNLYPNWYMVLGTSLRSSRFKKQTTMSKSLATVEYWSMSAATSEVIWLQWALSKLKLAL